MESSDNCDDGLYHKVLLLLAVVRFLQCDQRLYSQIPAEQQPDPHYLHYLHYYIFVLHTYRVLKRTRVLQQPAWKLGIYRLYLDCGYFQFYYQQTAPRRRSPPRLELLAW